VPAGEIFFYLVTGENLCGEGPAGTNSAGGERTGWEPCGPVGGDFDVDGVVDLADNCSEYPNAAQADFDGDFVGDICDNCMFDGNDDQADCNDDGIGNRCDNSSDCDADSLVDGSDNCPEVANPGQDDGDTDGIGDPCDTCPDDAINDPDHDLLCGNVDNCPHVSNADQLDGDTDFLGDACDACPLDDLNDVDSDSVCGDVDNCPSTPNNGQEDFDVDGAGDECDLDDDNDGVEDVSDCAALSPGVSEAPAPIRNTDVRLSKRTAGSTIAWIRSSQGHTSNVYRGALGAGQEWDTNLSCLVPETVEALYIDPDDPAPDTLFYYLVSARNICGESAAGADSDGTPTTPVTQCPSLGEDGDSDGILDLEDNCPQASNPTQSDADGDFVGDACDD
jgi:hypothetical protein